MGESGIPATWPNPWKILGDRTDVSVRYTADLPAGVLGYWSPRTRCINLAEGLTVVTRRWVLAHELGHVEGGHWWDDDEMLTRALEDEADDWASRKLAPIRLLADTARLPVRACAQALYLPTEAMMARMRHLHPSEIHVLRRAAARQREDRG